MANESSHNKAFTMIFDAMMENYESFAVADRCDNDDFVGNDNEE